MGRYASVPAGSGDGEEDEEVSTSEAQVPRHRWLAVAAALNERMSELGLDQSDLAAQAGLSPQIVRDLQRGVSKRYRSTTFIRMAQALGWPIDAFPRLLGGLSVHEEPAPATSRVVGAPRRDGIRAIESQVQDLERTLADLRLQLARVERGA